MQNFVRFHAIESKIKLSQKFWEKQNTVFRIELYAYPNCIIVIFNDTYFVYTFCVILFTRN